MTATPATPHATRVRPPSPCRRPETFPRIDLCNGSRQPPSEGQLAAYSYLSANSPFSPYIRNDAQAGPGEVAAHVLSRRLSSIDRSRLRDLVSRELIVAVSECSSLTELPQGRGTGLCHFVSAVSSAYLPNIEEGLGRARGLATQRFLPDHLQVVKEASTGSQALLVWRGQWSPVLIKPPIGVDLLEPGSRWILMAELALQQITRGAMPLHVRAGSAVAAVTREVGTAGPATGRVGVELASSRSPRSDGRGPEGLLS